MASTGRCCWGRGQLRGQLRCCWDWVQLLCRWGPVLPGPAGCCWGLAPLPCCKGQAQLQRCWGPFQLRCSWGLLRHLLQVRPYPLRAGCIERAAERRDPLSGHARQSHARGSILSLAITELCKQGWVLLQSPADVYTDARGTQIRQKDEVTPLRTKVVEGIHSAALFPVTCMCKCECSARKPVMTGRIMTDLSRGDPTQSQHNHQIHHQIHTLLGLLPRSATCMRRVDATTTTTHHSHTSTADTHIQVPKGEASKRVDTVRQSSKDDAGFRRSSPADSRGQSVWAGCEEPERDSGDSHSQHCEELAGTCGPGQGMKG